MAKERFRIGCVQCGTEEVIELDLDTDEDVAELGIHAARLLDDGHAVFAVDANVQVIGGYATVVPGNLN